MKSLSNSVYELVNSLSKSEKRYIEIYLSSNGKDGLKHKLFEAICKKKQTSIKAFEKQQIWTKHTYKLKHDLYITVLSQLENYHSINNDSIVLRKKLNQIEILFEKKLFNQCEKLVKQALKKAQEIENYGAIINLSNWRIKLLRYSKENNQYDTIFSEMEDAIDKLKLTNEFIKINATLYSLINTIGGTKKIDAQISLLLNNLLFTEQNSLKSFEIGYLYYHTWMLYYHYYDDKLKLYLHTKSILTLFFNNKTLIRHHAEKYISGINNHIIACASLYKQQEIDSNFQLLLEVPTKTEQQSIAVYEHYSALRMSILLNLGRIDEALEMENYINEGNLKYGKRISSLFKVVINFNLTTTFFIAHKLKKALNYVNLILQEKLINIREDVLKMVNIVNLLIHYDLKNYNLCEHLFLSYTRNLKNKTILELWFLDFYQHLLDEPLDKTLFKEEEKKLLSNLPVEESSLGELINLFVWIRLKHDKIDLSNALVEYYKLGFEKYKEKRLKKLK